MNGMDLHTCGHSLLMHQAAPALDGRRGCLVAAGVARCTCTVAVHAQDTDYSTAPPVQIGDVVMAWELDVAYREQKVRPYTVTAIEEIDLRATGEDGTTWTVFQSWTGKGWLAVRKAARS